MSAPLPRPLMRAVVVDDTPDLRDLIVLALETSGEIEVVGEAGNGREGVEQVERTRPDIVLLDLAMPVMDGLEALPHIRRLCPSATIIVLSGFGTSAMASRALEAGADGYIQKGASPAAILDYVRSLVGYAPSGLRLLPTTPRPVSSELVARLTSELAPIGIIVAKDDEWLTVVSVNPRAATLVGSPLTPGMTVARALPALAHVVLGLHAEDAPEVVLGDPPRTVSLTVRRSDGLVVMYVEPPERSEGSDLLRRAIATTAHEIRNPVTVLVGVADMMRDRGEDLDDDQRAKLRGAVVRQARLLDSITADLLTAAQAHRGTLRVDLTTVDVKEVLDAVLEGQPDDTVTVDCEDPARVTADPLRLEQMITNLMSNARKYGAPPIDVRVFRSGRQIVIEVSDRGPGVNEGFRNLLFDEFTRAVDTHARGTGLGLYVVRSLAEAQSGSISYEPRDGGGSTFAVRLPAAD